MAKFVALLNRLFLSVPLIRKDEAGKTIEDRTISFIKGTRVDKTITPAYFNTNDKNEIDYLRSYPGNAANGGSSFKELVEPAAAAPATPVVPIAPATPAAPAAAVAPAEPAATTPAPAYVAPELTAPAPAPAATTTAPPATPDGNVDPNVYPDVTNIQAAFAVLKTYDVALKKAEHRNKETILISANALGVKFPNL